MVIFVSNSSWSPNFLSVKQFHAAPFNQNQKFRDTPSSFFFTPFGMKNSDSFCDTVNFVGDLSKSYFPLSRSMKKIPVP